MSTAAAAAWEKATPELLNASTTLFPTLMTRSGARSQPTRKPVMAWLLDTHDDVLVNACIVLANVAKLSEPELRAQTLPVDDFVWMIPADKGHMYTTYALEGLAHTWRDDPGFAAGEFGQPAPSDGVAALLKSGGLARVAQYMDLNRIRLGCRLWPGATFHLGRISRLR